MSANVFGSMFTGKNTPAWHQLGTVFTDTPTASAAVERIAANFSVEKRQVFTNQPTPFGQVVSEVPGYFALIRESVPTDPQERCLGIVTEAYNFVQNARFAEIVDTITEQYPVDTVGVLGNGETIFICLKADTTLVGGEEVEQYFVMTDTKDGKTAHRMMYTPVRVVCQNTLIAGTNSASVLQWMQHTGDIDARLDYRMKLMNAAQKMQHTTLASFNAMAKAILSASDIERILEKAYPEPTKPAKAKLLEDLSQAELSAFDGLYDEATKVQEQWSYYAGRAAAYRKLTKDILGEMNEQNPSLANTSWFVYNAVVDTEDHRDGPAGLFESAIFGDRALTKKRAFAEALRLI